MVQTCDELSAINDRGRIINIFLLYVLLNSNFDVSPQSDSVILR